MPKRLLRKLLKGMLAILSLTVSHLSSIEVLQQATESGQALVILRSQMIIKSSTRNSTYLIVRSAVALAALMSFVAVSSAQAPRPTPDPNPSHLRISRSEEPDPMTSIEEEMQAKRAIKYAEKEYRENVERAHELADLGSQLSESFKRNKSLAREDLKKLDRLEKLTKAIRNAAGGSDSEEESKKVPADFAATLKKMFEVVESLADRVEKTPRHVISASVIDKANVLLELIRMARELSPKA